VRFSFGVESFFFGDVTLSWSDKGKRDREEEKRGEGGTKSINPTYSYLGR
jgi:hypothetical protein